MDRTIKAATVIGWLMMPILAFSQEFEWNRTFGRFGLMLFANDIATDEENNSYTTGYFSGTVDFDPGPNVYNLVSAGGYDIFIVKLNSSGELVWAIRMGGNQFDVGASVAVYNGFVYITGHFQSTSFQVSDNLPSLATTGLSDTYIAKLDYDGNIIFAGAIGGPTYNDTPESIAVDNEGNVLITGYFSGTADFDPSSAIFNVNSDAGNSVVYILKLNADCQLLWARYIRGFGLNNTQMGFGIAANETRDIYVTGYFSGTADFDPGASEVLITATGANDTFVLKLTEYGLFTWVKQFGGSFSVRPLDICVDWDQNILICGQFIQSVDLNPNSGSLIFDSNSTNIYVVKLNSAGNLIWGNAFGGNSTDVPNSISNDAVNNIYITGRFGSSIDFNLNDNSSGLLTAISGSDAFLCALAPTGEFIWNMSFAGAGSEEGKSVSVTSTGEVMVCGNFTSTTDFDFTSGNTATLVKGNQDGFIVKIGQSNFCTYLAGSSCDDNDPCTVNDLRNSDCTCVGELADTDNDGTCDYFDSCPAGMEPGTICDDGDLCTINDIISIDCNCEGVFTDSDNDAVCDYFDTCSNGPEPGTPCDDNNTCTVNDQFGTDCICEGTFADTDLDSICDAEDFCPDSPEPGTVCDDLNICTLNDVIRADCSCAGVYIDSDNDGVCNAIDLCNLGPEPGTPCDDHNPCTTNDLIGENCTCAGELNAPEVLILNQQACGSYHWLGRQYSASGTYSDTIQNYLGCDSILILNLTILSFSSNPQLIESTASSINPGMSVTLTVLGGTLGFGAVWKWYADNCGGSPIGVGGSVTVTPNVTTTYYVRAEGFCNTTSCSSKTIIVNNINCGPTQISASSNIVCSGGSTQLTVQGVLTTGAVWRWYKSGCGAGVSIGTGWSISVSPTSNSTYFVRAEGGSCNTSDCQSISIQVTSALSKPSSITGVFNGLCGRQNITYVASAVPGASSYEWTVPSGVFIVAGQGTNQITANFSTSLGSNNSCGNPSVCVRAINSCGASAFQCALLSLQPTTPGPISGPSQPCRGQISNYSCSGSDNYTTFSWTVPSGWIIQSGQGTNQIQVIAGTGSGNISVRANNACGQSATRSLSVRSILCGQYSEVTTTIWPNPASHSLRVEVSSEDVIDFEIVDVSGRPVLSGMLTSEIDVSPLPNGIYILKLNSTKLHHSERIIISK